MFCIIIWGGAWAAPKLFAQSGWTKPKGKGFIQLSASSFSSDRYFNTEGEEVLTAEGTYFKSTVFNLYAEHGVANRLNLMVNAPLLKLNSLSTTEVVGGVGDIRIGVKYQLSEKVPVSLSLEAEVPTGKGENWAKAKEQRIPGVIERVNLPASDGELNFWTTIALSQSFSEGKYYGSLFASVNSRTKGLSWQWQLGGEVGFQPIESLWLIGKARVQKSFSDEAKTVPFLFGEGTEFSTVSINAIYSLDDRWRLTAAYQAFVEFPVQSQNLYKGGMPTVGVAFEY